MKKQHFIWISLLLFIFTGNSVFAQTNEDQSTKKSAAEIAKELANPNTTLGTFSFPIDYIHYGGDLPGASSRNAIKINAQPSLPYPLGKGTNLFVRPLIPVIITQAYYNGEDFESAGVNLGDISADVAVGKTWPSGNVAIGGIFGSFPTATKKELGSGQTMIGPEFMWAYIDKWGAVGLIVTQGWGISGNSDENLSVTGGQYFYVFNLKNAWQITGQPTYSYVHNAPKGSRFTFPVGTGLNKTILAGKMPIKFSVQYWYYVASPEHFCPKHQVRFMVSPVLPLPW